MKTVKGYIHRKSMLYITGVEYGDYTMNHVLGCSHGCRFPCYAFMMKKRFGQVSSYAEWLQPYLVENTLDLLDTEIPQLKDRIKTVQLCFTTDPFMYEYEEISDMSIKAIKKLNENGIRCNVLTKGILPPELCDLSKENEYGITLVSLDESFRTKMEPFSAGYFERLNAMKFLHNRGCKTWVSIEPYPTPNLVEQNLSSILECVRFTDRIVFGRMNYNSKVTKYKEQKQFYNRCAAEVEDFCVTNGIKYYIKSKTISSDI